jgi:hypothetical protein
MEQVKAEAPQRPRPLTLGRTLTTGECMLQTQRLRGGPAADAVARALRCAAVFIAFAVLFNGAAMFIAGPAKLAGRAAYVSFRLVGLLGVLFWALRPAAAHDSAAGSKALIRFLHALAGACFVVRCCRHCNQPARSVFFCIHCTARLDCAAWLHCLRVLTQAAAQSLCSCTCSPACCS